MNRIHYALIIAAIAGVAQISSAHADDYDQGREAAENHYYNAAPDNTTSRQYDQGFTAGERAQQRNNSDGDE